MLVPTRRRERQLRAKGYRVIAGADEAGRGAWAGPLVAAAVILPETFAGHGIRDSKLLSPPERELHYARIVQAAIAWAVQVTPVEAIDATGVHVANLQAIVAAVQKLSLRPQYVLVDGWQLGLLVPCEGIVDGDQSVLSIAAASIVAKVTRDRLMTELHLRYPLYGFAVHKGYGTPQHQATLLRHGLSPVHRRSFHPLILEALHGTQDPIR